MSSEFDQGGNESTSHLYDHESDVDALLEANIVRTLHEQAEQVHFTRQLRDRVIQRLPLRRARSRRLVLAVALAAVLLLMASLATYLLVLPRFNPASAVRYVAGQDFATPLPLALQGQLLSVDPTMQHIVYMPAAQPGVLYTADLANAVKSNLLAMRDARDIAWSPDGSALVTTIHPAGVALPLLALVPTGQYMHLLGHDAEAASWLPTSTHEITFVTLANNHLHLWSVTPDGQQTSALATMNIGYPVQHLMWSHDGHMLALVVTKSASAQVTGYAGNTLYIMDARSGSVNEAVALTSGSIDDVCWSPDGRYLTYEQQDAQGQTTLNAITVTGQQARFTLAVQRQLQRWSWSPDSRVLVYSDGGTLKTHVLRGAGIQFPAMQGSAFYPFWLSDGRILYMHVTGAAGTLAMLVPAT